MKMDDDDDEKEEDEEDNRQLKGFRSTLGLLMSLRMKIMIITYNLSYTAYYDRSRFW
jgi:hypothetical protein